MKVQNTTRNGVERLAGEILTMVYGKEARPYHIDGGEMSSENYWFRVECALADGTKTAIYMELGEIG